MADKTAVAHTYQMYVRVCAYERARVYIGWRARVCERTVYVYRLQTSHGRSKLPAIADVRSEKLLATRRREHETGRCSENNRGVRD